jgi:hypothetical protein
MRVEDAAPRGTRQNLSPPAHAKLAQAVSNRFPAFASPRDRPSGMRGSERAALACRAVALSPPSVKWPKRCALAIVLRAKSGNLYQPAHFNLSKLSLAPRLQ